MLKFLHCADAHLDTPFSLADLEKADIKRAMLRATFSSLLQYVRTNNIHIVLLSGDLFSNAFVTHETAEALSREFAATPTCHFIIAPGTHDFYTPSSVYANTPFSGNVHIFKSDEVSRFSLCDLSGDGETVDIWGYACTSENMQSTPLSTLPQTDPSHINLFCGYADIGEDMPDMPRITKEQLAKCGFAYAALGGKHNSDGIRRIGQTCFGYAGCLEGRTFDECGYKGAIYGELHKNEDGKRELTVRRLRFSRRHFEKETLDVTGCNTHTEISVRITALLAEKKYDRDTALHLTLTGKVASTLFIQKDKLLSLLPPLYLFEICDETVSDDPFYLLQNDPTLHGAFARELAPILKSENEDDRETVKRALQLGLQAMKKTR